MLFYHCYSAVMLLLRLLLLTFYFCQCYLDKLNHCYFTSLFSTLLLLLHLLQLCSLELYIYLLYINNIPMFIFEYTIRKIVLLHIILYILFNSNTLLVPNVYWGYNIMDSVFKKYGFPKRETYVLMQIKVYSFFEVKFIYNK